MMFVGVFYSPAFLVILGPEHASLIRSMLVAISSTFCIAFLMIAMADCLLAMIMAAHHSSVKATSTLEVAMRGVSPKSGSFS